MVPGEEHSPLGTAPSRCTDSYGRHGVEIHEGSITLETASTDVYEYKQNLRTTGSGPICIKADQSVPSLLQLVARSICRGNRCISPGLEKHERVCQPTTKPDIPCFDENTSSGSRGGAGGISVEGSTMVYPTTINAGRLALPPTTRTHPESKTIPLEPQLAVWSISGTDSVAKAFQAKL